jgi:hypothetical protein
VEDLIKITNSPCFDGGQAIEMLQLLYTIDYGSRKAGSKAAAVGDEYYPTFFLDLLIIIGRPLKPITQLNDRFFDNVTITFKNWRASYSSKHVHGLPFDLEHRTFRLATAATREAWYIVMHPTASTITDLPSSRRERRKRLEKSSQSSALQLHHAHFLAGYIKRVFLIGELLGEGVEPSWTLNGSHVQNITFNKWTVFQNRFMEEWDSFVQEYSCDNFWMENQPAFHAYDYGANIEIELNEQLRSLPKETRLRRNNEESESEEDTGILEDGTQSISGRSDEREVSETPEEINYQSSYTKDLHKLRTELERKYILKNISSISYALAVDISCMDANSPDPNNELVYCLLADRNKVLGEFQGPRDFTFYPLAFHPAYGNFSSPQPPSFLTDNILAVMKDNMSYQNDGADTLNCGYFQAYSNIKRSIRHGPDDLLATKGIATGALALPETEANASARIKAKRQRLLRCLQGQLTPEDPDSSKPFARERQRIEQAIVEEGFDFRMEQVLSVQVSRLTDSRRSFSTVLNPIFQLIRFYLKESHRYTHLLRSFRPSVFPGILGSFARIFGLAIDKIYTRFKAGGSKGLGVALAEGVSALDRLGSYCFTGFPKSLMGSVLGPLGTVDGIRQGAWPYINPRMLDLQDTGGSLCLARWPRGENNRPLLMHVASIAFHYGPEVAASRHSNVWFKELGGMLIRGPSGAAKFLEDLFRDLWIPQTVAFVDPQFNRALRQGSRSEDYGSKTKEELQLLEHQHTLIRQWSQSDHPFSWAYVNNPQAVEPSS